MATGTDKNDTLRASLRGEVIHGKGGNDVLTSLFNRTELYGDSGNDRLKTTLDRREDTVPVTLSGTLSGGTGDDDLNADFYGEANDVTIAVTLDGGDGDDKITSNVAASTEVSGLVESNISAGAGRDTITASISMEGISSEEVWGTNRIDAGGGDDIVKALVYADHFGNRTSATNRIDGGLGNDRIEADAFIITDGGFYARIANDLDPISTIEDQGAGLDVVVTFDSGSVLIFEGLGLGIDTMEDVPFIYSIADLVENASAQLRVELV